MKRRVFIAGLGSAMAWPLATRAQQGERVRRVGLLTNAELEIVTRGQGQKLFLDELQKLGWVEGRNLRLDVRFGAGDDTQTGVVAADLVKLAPDVIVTTTGVALRTVLQETKTVPIVFLGAGDPVQTGMFRNLAHPEGNATGFANAFESLGGKWLELLKEVAPNITRVLFLHPPGFVGSVLQSVETGGQSLGVHVVATAVSDAESVKAAIEAFAAEPDGGLLPSSAISASAPFELIRMAEKYGLPAIYGLPYIATNGGLMSYSSDIDELTRGAVTYVDRLLRGAKVSDLPVQYPTKFRLVINLKTAKTLGLEVPTTLLARADEVIE
jgi:putative tryptophan/tyrosine transport system substrate-binding protein